MIKSRIKSKTTWLGAFTVVMAVGALLYILMAGGVGNTQASHPEGSTEQPMDHILVENFTRGGTSKADNSLEYAQTLRTGRHPAGYSLTGLSIRFKDAVTINGQHVQPKVTLYTGYSSTVMVPPLNAPETDLWQEVATWSVASSGSAVATGEYTYTYESTHPVRLHPNRQYHVVVGPSSSSLSLTQYTNEDGELGWSVDNDIKSRVASDDNSADFVKVPPNSNGTARIGRIQLNGSTNHPPKISRTGGSWESCDLSIHADPSDCYDENGNVIFRVSENLPGVPTVALYEADKGDIHTFSVGQFVHWLEWKSPEGRARFVHSRACVGSGHCIQSLEVLDYEEKSQYEVVVHVHDLGQNMSTSQKMIIKVMDGPDIPSQMYYAPEMKTTMDSSGKRDVQVCWPAPWNGGTRGPLLGYDLRYRDASSSDWTTLNRVQTSACLDASGGVIKLNPGELYPKPETHGFTLLGLEPASRYELQVQALNSAGASGWSPTGSFDTGGMALPEPTPEPTSMPTPEPTMAPTPEPTPRAQQQLTAEFRAGPERHGGENFTLELHFSEDIPDLSFRKVAGMGQQRLLRVQNARVSGAKRLMKGSNQGWLVTLDPHQGSASITVELRATTNCRHIDAICSSDGRKLSNTISASIGY